MVTRFNNCMKLYNDIINNYFDGTSNSNHSDYMDTSKVSSQSQVIGQEFLNYITVMNYYATEFNNGTRRPNWPNKINKNMEKSVNIKIEEIKNQLLKLIAVYHFL